LKKIIKHDINISQLPKKERKSNLRSFRFVHNDNQCRQRKKSRRQIAFRKKKQFCHLFHSERVLYQQIAINNNFMCVMNDVLLLILLHNMYVY
jgi:hypothetical protein